MITYTSKRDKGDGYDYDLPPRPEPVANAMNILVCCELAFGAEVTEVTETCVVTVTRIMGCIDTSVFEGSAEDMKLLVETAGTYVICNPMNEKSPLHKVAMDRVMAITGGNPLMLKLGGGMIIGGVGVKATMLAMLGPTIVNAPKDKLANLTTKDLLAALMLARVDGVAPAEALALAIEEVTS